MNLVDRRTRETQSQLHQRCPQPQSLRTRASSLLQNGAGCRANYGEGGQAVCQARTVLPNLETSHGCDTLAPQRFRSNQRGGHGVFSDVDEWKSIRQADLCHPIREPHLGSAGWPDRLQHPRCTEAQITLLCSNGKRESSLVELGRGQHGRPAWHWVPMKRDLALLCLRAEPSIHSPCSGMPSA